MGEKLKANVAIVMITMIDCNIDNYNKNNNSNYSLKKQQCCFSHLTSVGNLSNSTGEDFG